MVAPQIKSEDFSLRRLVLDVIARSETADPRLLTLAVLDKISTREAPLALAECLPEYVRVLASDLRNQGTSGGAEPTPHLSAVPDAPTQQAMPRSWKTQAVRRIAKILRESTYVDGDWKQLRDCTRDDLLTVVATRRRQADEISRRADWYEHLADKLAESGAATVGDLPEDVLASIVPGGAE